MNEPVVVDTNILFSALLSRGRSTFAGMIQESGRRFFVNELVLTELFKHKDRIARYSLLAEDDLVLLFYDLMRSLHFFKEDLVSSENRKEAYELCRGIDETDAPHVAIVLELDGLLWTGDQELREGLEKKGFGRFFNPGK